MNPTLQTLFIIVIILAFYHYAYQQNFVYVQLGNQPISQSKI